MAGGISNIILGFLLFLVIVPLASPMATNKVDTVVEHSYIESAGILPGDKIVGINGHKVSFYNDISLYTQDFTKDSEAEIVVKRNNEKLKFTIKPTEIVEVVSYTEDGVDYAQSVNGYDSVQHFDYSDKLEKNDELIGKAQTTTSYIIGFHPQSEDITISNVWGEAWNQTRFVVKLVYQSLWQLITGKAGMDQMSGPVGIVSEVNTAVNSGSNAFMYVMNLVALLTINLGVFNLLPIPALDGGRLFFMIIELIRRKPIPPEKEGMVHAIGMLLLFALIIFVSFNDIMKLIR
jgi:regulator of sigma E protease